MQKKVESKSGLPRIKLSPQLAKLTDTPPEGKEWLHEIKYDGYRILIYINHGKIKLTTRNNLDWSHKFPLLVKQMKTIPAKTAILDGELVMFDKNGVSHFQDLQNAFNSQKLLKSVVATIFDILYCNDVNLFKRPLIERKKILNTLFKNWIGNHPNFKCTPFVQGQGKRVFTKACKSSLEGIISKKIDSLYVPRRSSTWLKSKCCRRQEFIIIGFTKPKGSREYFGALLVGYYTKTRQLAYAGKVGTGFSKRTLSNLFQHFNKIIRNKPALKNLSSIQKSKEVTWVKPVLVCELKFSEWTKDGLLRHPTYIELRLDKNPKEVSKNA